MADDLGTGDIPLYWNSGLVDMPNIHKLASMGVTFKDAHSTPLCAPSRYMLLSGNYPHRGRVPAGTWNLGANSQFRSFQKSIGESLAEGGYHTAMHGKWHLGGVIPLHQNGELNRTARLSHEGHDWTQPLINGPQDIGFDSSLITSAGIQASPYSYFRDGFLTMNTSDVYFWNEGEYIMPHGTSIINTDKSGEGDPNWDSTAYNMVLVNETARFIDAHIASERSEDPWFVYAALGSVHIPHSPPDYYLDGSPVKGTYQTRHMDMLLEVDKAVGSLVTMVERKGLAGDTIIIFTSDNGGLNTTSIEYGHNSHGPLRGSKSDIYEGGHRVPLIFRYDGQFPVNETRNRMVGLNDVYRTLCNITGTHVPEASAQDSLSFADYIFSDNSTQDLRRILGTWKIEKGRIHSEALRFDNMKYIRYNGAEYFSDTFDLDSDLGEANNVTSKNVVSNMSLLRAIGPCPLDQNKFRMSTGPERGQIMNCTFFESDPVKCDNGVYLEGELFCSSICGRYKSFCRKSGLPYTPAIRRIG